MHQARSFVLFFLFVFVLVLGSLEATILRLDHCGTQYTKDQPIPILKSKYGSNMTVRGDLVDTATGILAPPGMTITIESRTGGGGTNTSLLLFIAAGPSVAVGDHNIRLNYPIEVGQPDIFKIRIKDIQITSISNVPAGDLQIGTPVTVTVNGIGLANVRIHLQSPFLTNVQNITTNNNTTYSFKGTAQASWNSSHATFFDSTLPPLGDRTYACNIIEEPPLSYRVGKSDLKVSKATVYRFLPQPEICAGTARIETQLKYCTDPPLPLPAPTATTPKVERLQNVGAIVYVVTNSSSFNIIEPFKVQLKNGFKVVKQDVINGLPAGGTKVFTFARPESRRMLMRHIQCLSSCYDLDQAPYNWRDPVYTTVVDADDQIKEVDENNNNVASD